MSNRIDWALWRSFLSVAETGSLSAAARALGLTQPTVGRHIDTLEGAVGQTLFLRTPQGLGLTEAAAALVPEARAMQLTADSLARRAASAPEAGTGTVRIAASHVVGAEVLPTALAPLLATHPGLAVELALSNDSADLLRREADLAIRMARPAQGSLVARRLGDVPLGLFAHRVYLDRAGRPGRLTDLKAHVLIGPDGDPAALAGLEAFGGAVGRSDLRLRTDSEAAQIASVRAGLGVGVMQAGIAARDPLLEPVLSDLVAWSLDAWLVLHDDLRRLPMVRLVADHLSAVLPAVLLSGALPPHSGATVRPT
ncbi:LysR family transcriptional regulator [Roseibacterium sp. SDUM158017]|uniref:LysR family transcriptional regulator n=1 Tax=Roseicyclus salinarum TaxID=3036773 RepID=UPI0024157D5B|nr:LysR family transcriptional regulator [Roseibacterium sp. SDUM158017]MDG4650361.1 LysR family transcriptional regulator [Roseibacterium sp. SDUM158017]